MENYDRGLSHLNSAHGCNCREVNISLVIVLLNTHTHINSKQANKREVKHKKSRDEVSDSSVSPVEESGGLKITLPNKRHDMEHVQNKGGDLWRVCR